MLLTSRQLANALDVSTQTVNYWVGKGCPYSMIGIRRMFDLDKVKQWYNNYKQTTLDNAAVKRWETIRQKIKEDQVGK